MWPPFGRRLSPPPPTSTPRSRTSRSLRQGTQGDPVTVSVSYDEVVHVPLIGWLFGASIRLDAAATNRQEFA